MTTTKGWTNKEKFWYFWFEGGMTIFFISAGYLAEKNIILSYISALMGILYFSVVSIFVSHYNIKPFFWKIFPKKIKEQYR